MRASPVLTGTLREAKHIMEMFSKTTLPLEGRKVIYLVEEKIVLDISD